MFFNGNPNMPNSYYDYTYVNNYRTVNNFNGAELGLNAVYTPAAGRWMLSARPRSAAITSTSACTTSRSPT